MESCVLYILKKKSTGNQGERDERRGKGELMFKSVLGRNKYASSYLRRSQAVCLCQPWWTEPLMNLLAHVTDEAVLLKPKASKEYEEIRATTKAVTEVMCN